MSHVDDDFDDLPETHLDDDAYDDFLSREFDAEGHVRGEPRVGRFILMVIVALAIVALLLFF